MEINLIQITGKSGCGKTTLASCLQGMLETAGYSAVIVDGRQPDEQDKEADFVLWTRISRSDTPQITFLHSEAMNDLSNALCGVKLKGSVGKCSFDKATTNCAGLRELCERTRA